MKTTLGSGNGSLLNPNQIGVVRDNTPAERGATVRYVASSATSPADCAELLDMLGLDPAEGLRG